MRIDSTILMYVFAIADAYGFRPSGPEWEQAHDIVVRSEGDFGDFFWWNMDYFYAHGFSPAETKEFALALRDFLADEGQKDLRSSAASFPKPQQAALRLIDLKLAEDLARSLIEIADAGTFRWRMETPKWFVLYSEGPEDDKEKTLNTTGNATTTKGNPRTTS